MKPAGAFNIRILSDSVPDWSSRENFVRSALSGWPTDFEKCLAQFRWSYRCRRVGSYVPEDNRPVLDPILFFNSYGITYCSMISAMNVSLWQAAGYPGRMVHINGHCVSEVFYGGKWRMFDNDFCNYFLDEKGEVASAEELFKGRAREPGRHYLYDHCPTASSPGCRIFMGPSSASLKEVAEEWYKEYRPEANGSGAHAGHRYILNLRPNQSYTISWRPTGTGKEYARLFSNGKDPAEDGGSPLRNSRSNGLWWWEPDLSDPAVFFATENVEWKDKALRMRDPAKPASVTFRVDAANVVTLAKIIVSHNGSLPTVTISADGGVSWKPVTRDDGTVGPGFAPYFVGDEVGGRLEYLLRFDLKNDTQLESIRCLTTTQVNPRVLPALRLGTNEIVALSDENLDYITLAPRLTNGQHVKEVYRTSGFEPSKNLHEWQPSIIAAGKAELVLRATAPRDIKCVRMSATAHVKKPGAQMTAALSFDGGKTWREIAKHDAPKEGFPDKTTCDEARDIPAGSREVLMRYAFNEQGGALTNVVAHVGFDTGGGFQRYLLTYKWDEWRDGKWTPRSHTESIDSPDHRYKISVGGTRPPRMNSITIDTFPKAKDFLGYSDRQDVGDKFARPGYSLKLGKRLSVGAAYTVSRPASAAFPDTGGKLLTDGYVSLASFWGLGLINLTGQKNDKRVGELVVWEPGDDVVVTLDLGKVQAIGAARICAVQPNDKVLFPEKITVEVLTDGADFKPAGSIGWEECFFPPADELVWEGADSPIYDHLPAGGIIDHKFPVIFEKPVEARFVRFRLAKPSKADAGIGLWELEVYDRIDRTPWSDRIRLPEKAPPAAK